MSVELLPPDQAHPAEYHVRLNQCRCHPETCCCNDWAVHAPSGDKLDTFYRKSDAEKRATFYQTIGRHS